MGLRPRDLAFAKLAGDATFLMRDAIVHLIAPRMIAVPRRFGEDRRREARDEYAG
jgi:hypothetical protein